MLTHANEEHSYRRISMDNGRFGFLLVSQDRDVLAQSLLYNHEGTMEIDI